MRRRVGHHVEERILRACVHAAWERGAQAYREGRSEPIAESEREGWQDALAEAWHAEIRRELVRS